jgi:hypothetical protein
MSNFIKLDGLPIYYDLLDHLQELMDIHPQICLNAPKGHEDDFYMV